MKAKTKRISFSVSIILILTVILSLTMTAYSAEICDAPLSADPDEITLYALRDWAKQYTEIPDSCPQSYQIDVSGLAEPTFTSLDPKIVAVSDSGLITPAVVYTYWYGYSRYMSPIEGKTPTRITSDYTFGSGEIKVSANNRTYFIRVNIEDYAETYATNIDLYYMDKIYTDYLSIPSSCPTSYKIPVSGMDNPQITSLDPSDVVVEEGVVSLAKETWYFYGNIGYSSPIQGEEPDSISETISRNGGYVEVSSGNNIVLYHINAVDYAQVYSDNVMREYVEKNITTSMSTYEKLDVIARFVANREYNYYYSNAKSLIIVGGGDCWASTDTVIRMSEMAGLKSWKRYGAKDDGAGGGHMNAMVYDGADYYEVEAGYYMNTPRYYYIKKRDTLFSYRYKDNGVEVYQYDNCRESLTDTLAIPREINGLPVVSIADYFGIDYCVQNNKRIENVIIPDTVTNIGQYAFVYCGGIKELTIPASVTSIGDNAFNYYIEPGNYANIDNKKFIVRGFKGTEAETYARNNEMTFEELKVLFGDVDRSGEVSVTDATFIRRHTAGINVPYDVSIDVADVNDDKKADLVDATYIQKWLSDMTVNSRIGQPAA